MPKTILKIVKMLPRVAYVLLFALIATKIQKNMASLNQESNDINAGSVSKPLSMFT